MITLFYIPTGSEAEALALGKIAVERRLAACANVFPIQSVFPWQGSVQQENEYVLLLKTIPSFTSALRAFVQETHTYDLPCILSWDVHINEEYENWVIENVG